MQPEEPKFSEEVLQDLRKGKRWRICVAICVVAGVGCLICALGGNRAALLIASGLFFLGAICQSICDDYECGYGTDW